MVWRKEGGGSRHVTLLVKDINRWKLLNKKFFKIIRKCLSATLAVFCIVVDNRVMGVVSFSGSLFTTISTYMNAENC